MFRGTRNLCSGLELETETRALEPLPGERWESNMWKISALNPNTRRFNNSHLNHVRPAAAAQASQHHRPRRLRHAVQPSGVAEQDSPRGVIVAAPSSQCGFP